MGLNLNNLPEKNYYTFQEIAKRWSCDINLVEQFIEQRKLRPAAILKELPIDGLIIDIEKLDKANSYYWYSALSITDGPLAFNNQEQDILPAHLPDDSEISTVNLVSKDQILARGELEQYKYLYYSPDYYVSLSTFGGEKVLCVQSVVHDRANILSNLILGRLNKKYFNYITKLERNRFENEFGITSETTDIKKEVAAKTENIYLQIIGTFSQALLGEEYSEKPHSNAAKIDKLLSSRGMSLPCTAEILAKYLKKQQ